MDFVVDAYVLGEVCRNNKKAIDLLEKIRKHRVVFCIEIFREYRALRDRKFCRNNSTVIREWLIELTTKSGYGKKVKINENINSCFRTLIDRHKFKKKDIIYINTAQKANDKLLMHFMMHFTHYALLMHFMHFIAFEMHFIKNKKTRPRKCIEHDVINYSFLKVIITSPGKNSLETT